MSDDHELVMPFVTVRSEGGPHEDDAYVAGWEMGALDIELQRRRPALMTQMIHAANAPQADLVGMKHGYAVEIKPVDDTWSEMFLTRTEES